MKKNVLSWNFWTSSTYLAWCLELSSIQNTAIKGLSRGFRTVYKCISTMMMQGSRSKPSLSLLWKCKNLNFSKSNTGINVSLEFKFCYFAYGQFAKFRFRLLQFYEFLNDSSYNQNLNMKICQYSILWIWPIWAGLLN